MTEIAELLSPAGSFESMIAAFDAGADAVYLGGSKFGARAYANNFNEEELLKAIDYAHVRGRKLYLTLNTLLKEKELTNELYSYLEPFYKSGLDAVIVQDTGIIHYLKDHFPELPLHASTQMTVTGLDAVKMLGDLGLKRVVTARELSLDELRYITDNTDVEIESFIHGAMCYCYSGQCLMSSIIGGRSGNRGRCAQPCRLPYKNEKGKGAYYLSLKDMCTYSVLGDLMDSKIASFKIEGRMKSPEYTAGVTAIYRYQMDLMKEAVKNGRKAADVKVNEADLESLIRLYSRSGSGTGYYFCRNGRNMITLNKPCYDSDRNEAAVIAQRTSASNSGTVKINGKLILTAGFPAKLDVCYNEVHFNAESDQVVSSALNAPLDEETVSSRMRKTGGTPFVFGNLDIQMGNDCYMPVKLLNQLRRDALSGLESAIAASYRRQCPNAVNEDHADNVSAYKCENPLRSALVSLPEQLKAVLKDDSIQRVYLERNLWPMCTSVKKSGREVVLAFPHIMRKNVTDGLDNKWQEYCSYLSDVCDGVLIRNLESWKYLNDREYSGKMIADANLYTWNKEAVRFWNELGVHEHTVPYELNYNEIMDRGADNSALVVYGYMPVMITAQCIQKTFDGCTSEGKGRAGSLRMITDRYKTEFPAVNRCRECYNIIYNSVPTCLIKDSKKIRRLAPAELRYDFTFESANETTQILNGVILDKTTRGHFARGVE